MLETFSITQISKGGKVFIFSFFKLHSWVEEVFLFEEEKARLWIPIPILSFFIRYAMFIENLFLFFPLHIQWMRTTRVQGKKKEIRTARKIIIFLYHNLMFPPRSESNFFRHSPSYFLHSLDFHLFFRNEEKKKEKNKGKETR